MRSRGLNPKHLKALELFKQGNIPFKDVSKLSGISEDHLFDLVHGNEKAGPVAEEFKKHMEEIDKRISDEQKMLKECVTRVLRKWAFENEHKKKTPDDLKRYINIAKVLQTGPVYNIGSVSYSKGLNPQEMVNEFKRLRATSEGALDRRTVSGPIPEGSGVLPPPSGRGSEAEKGQEDPSLPAES